MDTVERIYNKKHGTQMKGYRVRSEEGVSERVLANGRVINKAEGGTRPETAKDRYADKATELIMSVVEALDMRRIWGLDDDVKHQLCTRGYDQKTLEKGGCKTQKKKEWRDTQGGQSPDELDAVSVCLARLLDKKILVLRKNEVQEAPQNYGNSPAWQRPKPI